MLRKGVVVRWHGDGLYRIDRVYRTGELRIESIAYPGVFHMATAGAVRVVRNAA